jgi:hypothetical protein
MIPNGLGAQTFDATDLREPTNLAATWLVHGGDDPAYARPDFDDSQWMKFDSTKDLHDLFPRDHPKIVWYRLHMKVAPNQTDLALKEQDLSHAFEIYSNGNLFMKLGQIRPLVPYTLGVPLLATIPAQQTATGSVLIALRVHISKAEWKEPDPGFYSENLILGREPGMTQAAQLAMIPGEAEAFAYSMLYLGFSIVVFALYLTQPRQREYLWLALHAFMASMAFIFKTPPYNFPTYWLPLEGIRSALVEVFGFLMYSAFLRRPFGWRTKVYIAIASLLMVVGVAIDREPVTSLSRFPLLLLSQAFVLIILIRHFRRGNREAGILLIPLSMWCLSLFLWIWVAISQLTHSFTDRAAGFVRAIMSYKAGAFTLHIWDFTSVLYLLSFAIIVVLRTGRMSRQQAVIEGELAAAREVQQVLVPEEIESIPGFAVESVYQPAQQVGGDFFQILPNKTDDSLLIVAGDVTGKGLQAGMLVAMLVGAIRTAADTSLDPEFVLRALNQRLLGRGHAQATCLALSIDKNGETTLANAGHIAPYLNGEPMDMEGAVPLGMIEGAEFSVMQFRLKDGDKLVLISDGVVEAMDAKGNLFGFERVHELLRAVATAAEVASVAQSFGQEDDISVISVTRTAVVEPTLA